MSESSSTRWRPDGIASMAAHHAAEEFAAEFQLCETSTEAALTLLDRREALSPEAFVAEVEKLNMTFVARDVRLLVCSEARRAIRLARQGA